MKILVIDDDNISRLLLRKILEQEGHHEIAEADNGQKAWDQLQIPPPPNLCLLDLMMPGIEGLHLLQKIRSDTRLKQIKVIVCSAINTRQAIEKAASLEVSAYLLKPFTAQKVLREVQKIQDEIGGSDPLFDPPGTRQRLGIDIPFYVRLLQILAQETDQSMARLLTAESSSLQSDEVLMALHALKTSSKNLGALALRNALEGVESSLNTPQQPQLSASIKQLAAENKRLKTAITHVQGPAAAP